MTNPLFDPMDLEKRLGHSDNPTFQHIEVSGMFRYRLNADEVEQLGRQVLFQYAITHGVFTTDNSDGVDFTSTIERRGFFKFLVKISFNISNRMTFEAEQGLTGRVFTVIHDVGGKSPGIDSFPYDRG